MRTRRPDLLFLGVLIAALVVIAALGYGNYRYAESSPGGYDFIPRWLGTHLYLTEGDSPYSPETRHEIQKFVYGGRLARPGEDKHLFTSPFYSMVVYLPFSLTSSYPLARAMWMTVSEIGLVALAFGSLALTRWKPPAWMLGLYLLFSLGWYHAVHPVVSGSPAVVVAVLVVFCLHSVLNGRDTAAGILLALSMIKPQMVALFAPFVLLWALSRGRWRIIGSFAVSMAVLLGGSFLLQPDWLVANLRLAAASPGYNMPGTMGAVFVLWWQEFGAALGWIVSGLAALLLLREWMAAYGKDERWFLWAAALTLVLTNLVGIRTAAGNYIALFPALALVFSIWEQRWARAGRWLVVISLAGLLVGLWWLDLNTLIVLDQPWQHPVMFFPLPVFLLFGLYWVRYWALGSRRLQIEELKALRDL